MKRWMVAVLVLGCARVELEAAAEAVDQTDAGVSEVPDAAMPTELDADVEPAALGTEPRLFLTTTEEGTQIVDFEGLPALSADGRHVLTFHQWNDYGGGELELLSTRTGRIARRIAWPQELGEEAGEIDVLQQHRIEQLLERGAFTTLHAMTSEVSEDMESTPTRFSDDSGFVLYASYATDEEEEPFTLFTIEHAGAQIDEWRDYNAGNVGAVYRAPDGSFVLVGMQFCACDCATLSKLVPIG